MFIARFHARIFPPKCLQARFYRAKKLAPGNLVQAPIANQLNSMGLRGMGGRKKIEGDKTRINIVGEELCDDIIEYIKPTLDRHGGCDLIDIYPGAGLWSTKLHEALKPRSHILMEPDGIYKPFLEPLLAMPGVTHVPESGYVWESLHKVLSPKYLPYQAEIDPSQSDQIQRNDTLLVTMNLCFNPIKRIGSVNNLANLLLSQIMRSVRKTTFFEKYGHVRLFVWLPVRDKQSILPHSTQYRWRIAFEAETCTDWICEIAGAASKRDVSREAWYRRDQNIDLGRTARTLKQMANGTPRFVIPAGRENFYVKEVLTDLDAWAKKDLIGFGSLPLKHDLELEDLQRISEQDDFDKRSRQAMRRHALVNRASARLRCEAVYEELLRELDNLKALWLAREGQPDTMYRRLETEWISRVEELSRVNISTFVSALDNMHVARQDPPVLKWDQRYVESLAIESHEFWPNQLCALLDIQPRSPPAIIRKIGDTSAAGLDLAQTLEYVLRGLWTNPGMPIGDCLAGIADGADEGVLRYVPSLLDPRQGGSPVSGPGQVRGRALNIQQICEILEGWQKWPFAPTWPELLARMGDEIEDSVDEDGYMMTYGQKLVEDH